MTNNLKSDSNYINSAKNILLNVKGKTLDDAERLWLTIQLASAILQEALQTQTKKEKEAQKNLSKMMEDPIGKAFTCSLTDECFRSHSPFRTASQIDYLIQTFGIPHFLPWAKRFALWLFSKIGKVFAPFIVPFVIQELRHQTQQVILPEEPVLLRRHIAKRKKEKVHLNLNHLGEAILGEEEAQKRLQLYIHDLKQEDIECVSIKISTLYSQIHLISWDQTLEILAQRLRLLYRTALTYPYKDAQGKEKQKIINLDMEEYKDLQLTKELFKKVLSEEEFLPLSAGIVLQTYLPDALGLLSEFTLFAKERRKRGGYPLKLRLVKGANLAMEKVEASLKGWPQAPYLEKKEVDANYKKLITFALQKENAESLHIGIASHNLFDIAYALILRAENRLEPYVHFEMLEGMADHIRRVVGQLSSDMLLYCPVAKKEDFHYAIAYLMRRLDENTGEENFLRHAFGLKPGSKEWEKQVVAFIKACEEKDALYTTPRRVQNRYLPPKGLSLYQEFENEADTDFCLIENRRWAENIAFIWKNKTHATVPLQIGGRVVLSDHLANGFSPSDPNTSSYQYSLASSSQVEEALTQAKNFESTWRNVDVEKRIELLCKVAGKLREHRKDLIGVMMLDGGKAILEADPEVSEAIDFAEYYARSLHKMAHCKDISWKMRGTLLITPPWNFPIAIPSGGILASLATGNCVIFKPAPESILCGWLLVNLFWDAGIPKEALQFICCEDDPTGSQLIQDKRLNGVILTGATSTAKLFKKLAPTLPLFAETGGKNSIIITAMSDRDLAIKDLIQSAFGHSGQKCSAASLAILEKEVYDDPVFLRQLRDATLSLIVDSPWNLAAKITPLIRKPSGALLRAITTLEKGESWLVEPKIHPLNPNLVSPGIKLGVKENSFMHTTELFGPVLGIMRAENLREAIRFANGTAYGLTSGIHTLDKREIALWMQQIKAGNCYINRTITGAIVRRQPFGGCKESNFGPGAKAGGPDYLFQLAIPEEVDIPHEIANPPQILMQLTRFYHHTKPTQEELGKWHSSLGSYSYHSEKLQETHDPSLLLGQDNLFTHIPHEELTFRIQKEDSALDIFRVLAAALLCKTPLEISLDSNCPIHFSPELKSHLNPFRFIQEDLPQFLARIQKKEIKRIRHLSSFPFEVIQTAAEHFCFLEGSAVLCNGRIELLHYLREVVFSIDYHRYGNLMQREKEIRSKVC